MGLLLTLCWLPGCDAILVDQLQAQEASEVVRALSLRDQASSQERIPRSQPPRYRVRVKAAQLQHARLLLQRAGLPRPRRVARDALLEHPPVLPTPAETRLRARAERAAALEQTLRQLPGVRDAHLQWRALGSTAPDLDQPEVPIQIGTLLFADLDGPAPDLEAVRRALVAGLPEGVQISIELLRDSRMPARGEAAAGPGAAPAEAHTWLLPTSLAVNALLAALLLWAVQRRGRPP